MPFPWPDIEGQQYAPLERGERQMKHNLKISLAQGPERGGIVRCKTVSLRERVLRRLFGDMRRVTIIVPGDSVEELSVREVAEVGVHGGA